MDDTHAQFPANTNPNTSLFNLASPDPSSGISPLEQDVLDQYERLLRNMNQLSSTLSTLASGPMTLEIADGLRLLERQVASVYTLMKASVYSIVMQQGEVEGDGVGGAEGGYGD